MDFNTEEGLFNMVFLNYKTNLFKLIVKLTIHLIDYLPRRVSVNSIFPGRLFVLKVKIRV